MHSPRTKVDIDMLCNKISQFSVYNLKLHQRYEVVKSVYQGPSSQVFLVRDITDPNRPLVVKFKPEGKLIRIEHEALTQITSTLRNMQSTQSNDSGWADELLQRLPSIESQGLINIQKAGQSSVFHVKSISQLNPNSPKQSQRHIKYFLIMN